MANPHNHTIVIHLLILHPNDLMQKNKFVALKNQLTVSYLGTFMHNNFVLPNNSVVLREEVGEGDKALSCKTLSDAQCGGGSSSPELFYPNKTQVSSDGKTMYSSYGTGLVYLNRREADKSPLGAYCCRIQDSQGNVQKIFIKIGMAHVTI